MILTVGYFRARHNHLSEIVVEWFSVCGGRRCTSIRFSVNADARVNRTVLTMACIGPRGRLCARIQEKLCQWGQQTTTHAKKKSYLCSKYVEFQRNRIFETQVSRSFDRNLKSYEKFYWLLPWVRSCALMFVCRNYKQFDC